MTIRTICAASIVLCAAARVDAQTKPMPVPVPRADMTRVPSWATPPKLVVGIVIDQMRTDFIYRYWDNFGTGGFKRLIGEGAFLRNAHFTYIPTYTGPGHASIYTGSVPAYHGIVANDRYDRETRKMIYCVKDTAVQGIGSVTAQGSPHQLLATTLADEIERRTDGKGKTIGVSLKDRASVLPIGRTGDAAYWFSGGAFVTSTWYMNDLPKWASEFNARKPVEAHLDRTWTPLLPLEKYHKAMPDENPYEQPLTPGGRSAFPYNLAELSKGPAGVGLITTTPWGNTLTTDFALAALAGEGMGLDNSTDLLAISYSSTDILGHKMGPRSLEVEDMYIRLDQEIARLLTELDRSVGAGKYTLFLTSDHGAVDVPAYLKDLKGSAGYVDLRPLLASLNKELEGTSDSIAYLGDGQVFLASRTSKVQGSVASSGWADRSRILEALLAHPAVHSAWRVDRDSPGSVQQDEQYALLMNGHMAQRCGDILYTLKPGYFEAEGSYVGRGTTHGSGWTYDTHVPIVFFGQGVAQGEVLRRTAVADIAPTVCMIVGCALPDAAVGEPVKEVLAK